MLPTVAMTCFLSMSLFPIVSEGASTGRDKYAGIMFMCLIGFILTIINVFIYQRQQQFH